MVQKEEIFSDDPKNKSWMKKQERPMMLQDRMHGFLFFGDIVSDFRQFDPSTIDPLQRANVPLLERDTAINTSNKAKSPLLLMTDYGSCNPHEAVQGAIRTEEEYFVQFWQYIDVFCYFTHGHIAIPPPTWINAAHRNGVQVIGTLIFEGDDPQTAAMLEVDAHGEHWLADKLAHVAAICGFDGWLLNVESRVHEPTTNAWDKGEGMIKFITNLRKALEKYHVPKGGKVIWYDAVTPKNVNDGQGMLNEVYIGFARAAKSVIVDYNEWDATNVQTQAQLADKEGLLGRDNVYLGRKIFKKMGNGLALKPVANEGVGSGLFATGWCFQKFSPPEDTKKFERRTFRSDADKYMWTGAPDLAELQSAGVLGQKVDNQINTQSLTEWIAQMKAKGCITAYAREYTAGSEAFFYTNYGTAMTYREETNDYSAHLNEQSVWPAVRASPLKDPPIHITTELKKAFGCKIGVENKTATTDVKGGIFLHYVHLKRDVDLALTMRYTRVPGLAALKIWLCAWANVTQHPAVEVELTDAAQHVDVALGTGQDPIVAIGLRVEGPLSLFPVTQNKHILDIVDILVKPLNEKYDAVKFADLDLVHNAAEDVSWTRLKWNVPPVQNKAQHLPYSVLTGSFSHFDVFLAGKYIGRSHTLAYVWDEQSVTKLGFAKGASVEVRIVGTQFDGTKMEVFKGQKTWP